MLVLRWVLLALYLATIVGYLILLLFNPEPALFLLLGVFIACQALFIFGSGTIHLCRPIRRRRLIMPIVVASFMLTVLIAGFVLAMIELLKLKNGPDWLGILFLLALGASWIIWGVLLYFHVRDLPRYRAMSKLTSYIFAGSLAELLATVPAHVIVSRRPGCFVGLLTMIGIIAGASVMLFSFGPAILLLFLRPRHRAEHAEAAYPLCPQCGYDLRATKDRCPECGLVVHA
jgi:hypothetical protein